MSNVKISSELFLGAIEQNKIIQFLDTDGYRKKLLDNSLSFGLIKNTNDNTFINGFVIADPSNANSIIINEMRAIDGNGNFLYTPAVNAIAIPNDSNWYWIKVVYGTNNLEVGTVSIDTAGNLIGTGTKFLSSLRGQPDFPSLIKLSGSTLNTGSYQVLSVTDDTHAQLQGATYSSESNLRLIVIGTFTPGYIPPSGDQNIFVYDACTISQQLYNHDFPPLIGDNTVFFLARVQNNGGTLSIEDKRNLNIWETRADYNLHKTNPVDATSIFGVEQVMWQSPVTDLSRNSAVIGWGFRSNNWTINSNLNILTILGGNGGRAKSTAAIGNAQFVGWRVYTSNGNYRKVISCSVAGSQINLYLDELNPTDFPVSSSITIVPDAEEIEIICQAAAFAPYDSYSHNQSILLPIRDAIAVIPLVVFNSGVNQTEYALTYRLKNHNWYSAEYNDSRSNTYYNEEAFDGEGNITDPSKITTGTSNRIFLQLNPNALYNIINALNTGDLQGIQNISTWSNVSPIITLQTGVNRNNIFFGGADFTAIGNLVLNLLTTGAKQGSTFTVSFRQIITFDPALYTVDIRQDYINPGSPGTLIQSMDNEMLGNARSGIIGECKAKFVFDGTNWNIEWLWDERYEGAWKSFTPVLKDAAGTIITLSGNTCKYKLLGKTLFMRGSVQFTNGGFTYPYRFELPAFIRNTTPVFASPESAGIGILFVGGTAITSINVGASFSVLHLYAISSYVGSAGAANIDFNIVTEIA